MTLLAIVGGSLLIVGYPRGNPSGSAPYEGHGGPLVVDEDPIDLGLIRCGVQTPFSVRLRNMAAHPISIVAVTPGCGCTSARVDRDRLQPGQVTHLRGQLNAKFRVGRFSHSIVLSLDGGRTASQQIAIAGAVQSHFALSPRHLHLRPRLDEPHLTMKTVTIQNTSQASMTVTDVDAPDELLVTFSSKRLDPGDAVVAKFRVAPDVIALQSNTIVFRVADCPERTITLPVTIDPIDGIIVAPKEIELGVVTREQLNAGVVRLAELRGPRLERYQLLDVKSPPFVQAVVDKTADGYRLRIRLIREKINAAVIDEKVTLTFAVQGSRRRFSVLIPLRGFVAS